MLARRVPQGDVFDLDTINMGFVRPGSSEDWQMAYCQAELYAEYMLARFGDDSLAKMLDCYADNLTTPVAIKRSFGVEQNDFEKGYSAYIKKLVESLSVGGSKPQPMTLAELDRARKHNAFERGFDLDPLKLNARLFQLGLCRLQGRECLVRLTLGLIALLAECFGRLEGALLLAHAGLGAVDARLPVVGLQSGNDIAGSHCGTLVSQNFVDLAGGFGADRDCAVRLGLSLGDDIFLHRFGLLGPDGDGHRRDGGGDSWRVGCLLAGGLDEMAAEHPRGEAKRENRSNEI